ncbi:O-methyltransferase-domain-containing protein [Podospora aff. communis PSN243]|uniref:O-methyltransferase-domain-containing protein n=1 Tax=Podospora aff. communis PSN243 TaxID=3040156 RepID=A0AAV9G5I4_9PEZI|nr:O-methyltransferase-domain-containing protein [Podospora aff. communis PSN243]
MSSSDKTTWTTVDTYTLSHTHPPSRPNSSLLASTLSTSHASGLPDIAASRAQAKFLSLFLRATNTTSALEIGTLGGFTSIFLASENPQLRVTTIEVNPEHAEVAKRNIAAAGLSDRIDVILGAGVDVLAGIRQDVDTGKKEKFGFVFIDADKENNWNYFDVAAGIVKSKGVVVVDNVVRGGKVADEGATDSRILGARRVIEEVGRDGRVDSVVLQTVGEKGYDGWLWAVVN